jgi:hypothetical protein
MEGSPCKTEPSIEGPSHLNPYEGGTSLDFDLGEVNELGGPCLDQQTLENFDLPPQFIGGVSSLDLGLLDMVGRAIKLIDTFRGRVESPLAMNDVTIETVKQQVKDLKVQVSRPLEVPVAYM